MNQQLVIAGQAVYGTCPSWWRRAYAIPQDGMEYVCRVVVNVHDPVGLEFSLSNQMNAMFWVRKPEKVGLFTHTKVTVTCEWPVAVTWSLHISLRSLLPKQWLLTVIALIGI